MPGIRGGRGLTTKEDERTFSGNRKSLRVDFSASKITVPIYYNHSNFTSHMGKMLSVCKLYAKKPDLKRRHKKESPGELVETDGWASPLEFLILSEVWGEGSKQDLAFLTNPQVRLRLPVGDPTLRTTVLTNMEGGEHGIGIGSLAVGYLPLINTSVSKVGRLGLLQAMMPPGLVAQGALP